MRALWYPQAVRRPGPAHKPDGVRPHSKGLVYHSVVGSLAAALSVLDGPGAANWHATVAKDGTFYQHYPLNLHCDHAGNHDFNDSTLGVEFEGGPPSNVSELWTSAQEATGAALLAWLLEEEWIPRLSRSGPGKSLWRHYEVPGAATACDSGRCPWATIIRQAQKEEDDDMLYIFKHPLKATQWWVGDRVRSKRKVINGTELRALRRDGAKEIAVTEELFNAMG